MSNIKNHFTFRVYKWCYKKEEEKDKEYYKHVNNTYKQIEKYSEKYLQNIIYNA